MRKFSTQKYFLTILKSLPCIWRWDEASFFWCGGNFDPKSALQNIVFLILVFAPAGWPVLAEVLKAFFVCKFLEVFIQWHPSTTWISFLCAKNTPKNLPNFDFWVGTKFWAFCVRQTLTQKKLPFRILSELCGSKTICLF